MMSEPELIDPSGTDGAAAPTIMLLAGEMSGDMHTARVARAILQRCPQAKLFGAGGPLMKQAGVELLLDLTQHAVVGLTDVLANYPKFRRFFYQLVQAAEQRRPDVVVLTDNPGFNLRFAKQMKKRGIRVFYYVSPQVWAWGQGRVKEIARIVDLMMVIFPFEKQFYAQQVPTLPVAFVGHPMIEQLQEVPRITTRDPGLVALLPGSRVREVERILPPMVGAVRLMLQKQKNLRFELAAASPKIAALARKITRDVPVTIVVGGAQQLMQRAGVGMVASGTATLECAFFGLPHVIVYRVSWLTYGIGRLLVKVPHLGIVNVIAGREVVREFIQHRASPKLLATALAELLEDADSRRRLQYDLAAVVGTLEGNRAAEQAAETILMWLAGAPAS